MGRRVIGEKIYGVMEENRWMRRWGGKRWRKRCKLGVDRWRYWVKVGRRSLRGW
jgi:hypothetical protein